MTQEDTGKTGALGVGERVTVCFVGQPHWVRKVCESVSRHSTRLRPSFVPVVGAKPWEAVKELRSAQVVVRVGLRPGACTAKGIAFDTVWGLSRLLNSHAAVVYYWIGSDVLRTIEAAQQRRLTPFFRMALRHRHLAGAPWLAGELWAGLRIPATPVLFPTELPRVDPLPPLPRRFCVLTYVPDHRHEFYGGRMIHTAARELDDIRFMVVGGHGKWTRERLPNLHFCGWCSNMLPVYVGSTVVVRLVQHDSLGGMVKEALALGRHAIYSYRVPFTHYVEYGDTSGLTRALAEYRELHRCGILGLNEQGARFACREWEEGRLVRELETALLEAVMGETPSPQLAGDGASRGEAERVK